MLCSRRPRLTVDFWKGQSVFVPFFLGGERVSRKSRLVVGLFYKSVQFLNEEAVRIVAAWG